jgi:hypothetical protein
MHSVTVVTRGWGNIGMFTVEVNFHKPGSTGIPSANTDIETSSKAQVPTIDLTPNLFMFSPVPAWEFPVRN